VPVVSDGLGDKIYLEIKIPAKSYNYYILK